jgi:hypothetical protein
MGPEAADFATLSAQPRGAVCAGIDASQRLAAVARVVTGPG